MLAAIGVVPINVWEQAKKAIYTTGVDEDERVYPIQARNRAPFIPRTP
jgi:hypothetical protein